jgi:membrane protein
MTIASRMPEFDIPGEVGPMRFSISFELFKRAFTRFFAKDTFEMGAALAYYTVFSLAPLLLIAISIAGVVFGEQAAQGRIAAEIENAVGPTVAKAIEETLSNARSAPRNTTASIVGVLVLLFGAGGVFGQLQDSLNTIWDVPAKDTGGWWGLIRSRFLSFAMVLGIGFLLIGSLIISTALSAMSNVLAPGQTVVAQLLNQVISFGFITVLFALIFKVLPDRHVAWRDVWVGAAVTSVLFAVGKYLIGLYLGRGSVTSAYGAAGSLVVILLWVYYASQILLFGAQLTQVYATQKESVDKPTADGRTSPDRTAEAADRRPAEHSRLAPQ